MPAALLKQQYQLLQSSRHVLFGYCESIAQADFIKELEGFGHGSIRNVLCHVADVYIHWLQNIAQSKNLTYIDRNNIITISDVRHVFEQTDMCVADFIDAFADKLINELNLFIADKEKHISLSPLALFTHVLTHEFHHKGQIASVGRALGYIAPDTDMIRT
jgi:uncharacterized damage-inducible protein DinB